MATPRWHYRFDNFKRALLLLQEAAEEYAAGGMRQIAKEGMIQRFEFCLELAWKTMKDYLEYNQVVIGRPTPPAVIREALVINLIQNGEAWMGALEARNKTSHVYDSEESEKILTQINETYLACFQQLHKTLAAEYEEAGNAE